MLGSPGIWPVQGQRQQQAPHGCLDAPPPSVPPSTGPGHRHLRQGLPGCPGGCCGGYLEVFEAQLAAEQLMLLPHMLLQVPKEAKRWQLRTPWALMLQQLPRETPRATSPRGHSVPQHHSSRHQKVPRSPLYTPVDTLRVGARRPPLHGVRQYWAQGRALGP